MTTFDQILPITTRELNAHTEVIAPLEWLLINRDLNGKVRFIVPESIESNDASRESIETLYATLANRIAPHAYPVTSGILYESAREPACHDAVAFRLDGFDKVWVVDRLATESRWESIADVSEGAPRIVFFSIKGGVGRSTALAATAWTLAQAGKRVLVLDLDLESPGLSSSLLPPERQPAFGITDWLVEDLVNNADAVFEGMLATSHLAHDGEIYVIPAHGANPGEYVSKLGRIWMPKTGPDGTRENWSGRLQRLLIDLEDRIQPDVVLIDSRVGIDEVASACVTDLNAKLVLLFALEGVQTWNGYRILFEHWLRTGAAEQIRERLQYVAALVPEMNHINYLADLREHAYQVFMDTLYDEIAPPAPDSIGRKKRDDQEIWQVGQIIDGWNFDEADESAPHYPWPVHWHRSFAGLRSLEGRLAVIDDKEITSLFGSLIAGIAHALNLEEIHA